MENWKEFIEELKKEVGNDDRHDENLVGLFDDNVVCLA